MAKFDRSKTRRNQLTIDQVSSKLFISVFDKVSSKLFISVFDKVSLKLFVSVFDKVSSKLFVSVFDKVSSKLFILVLDLARFKNEIAQFSFMSRKLEYFSLMKRVCKLISLCNGQV